MDKAKNLRYEFLGLLFTIFALALLGFSIFVHHRASSVGTALGDAKGTIVGIANGSYNGIIKGMQKGIDDAKEDELLNPDTTVDVSGTFKAIGKLEVLRAGVTLKNINVIGDTYKALRVISGNAIFSVDLSEADIRFSEDGKNVYIHIPTPTLELYLDQSSTEKLAETQKFSLTVKAQDGFKATLNSMTQTVDSVKDSLSNYDTLMDIAKQSAKKQVTMLASNICGKDQPPQVEFLNEEGSK